MRTLNCYGRIAGTVSFLISFFIMAPLPAAAQSCPRVPASSAEDCNGNNNADACDSGGNTFVIFDGNLIGVPANDCRNDGIPDDCQQSCYAGVSTVDADGDGVPNCQEEYDQTDPCDAGSRIQRLNPVACGSPNGFFGQVNIATVINTSFANLNVTATYFSADGVARGTVNQALVPNQKWDIIVNDLGLSPDTYGTFCVNTGGSVPGLWTGGLTVYKLRTPGSAFNGNSQFDFALYYPFKNPEKGRNVVPVNTYFPLNPNAVGTVANWIRLIDASPGNGLPLQGQLNFYDPAGANIGSIPVNIVDGGRNDFGGHEQIGPNNVGLAEFVPASNSMLYYIEGTRYFYEGTGAASNRFFSAFPIPVQTLSGRTRAAAIGTKSNEFSVVELLNGTASPLSGGSSAYLQIFDNQGISVSGSGFIEVPALGTLHRIVSGTAQNSADGRWSQVGGPHESLNGTALVYGFGTQNGLEYAYATPLVESPGPRQITEFNTFIEHENTLKLINASIASIKVDFSIFDFNHTTLPVPAELTNLTLVAGEYKEVELTALPKDTYGTIVAHVQDSRVGLVMINNVSRSGAYVMPFVAR